MAHKFGRIQEGIARQQAATAASAAETSRRKLKLDLFDRRWSIYKTAIDTVSKTLRELGFPTDSEFEYFAGIQSARWLLNEKVSSYLEGELVDVLNEFHYAHDFLGDPDVNAEHEVMAEHAAKKLAAKEKVMAQRGRIEELFAPFLQIEP